jgi:hypothetical protein
MTGPSTRGVMRGIRIDARAVCDERSETDLGPVTDAASRGRQG